MTSKKLLVALMAVFVSCTENDMFVRIRQDLPQIQVAGEEFYSDSLLNALQIYVADSVILTREGYRDIWMSVIDMRTKEANLLLKRGRGPGEALGPFAYAYLRKSREICVLDITLQKIMLLDMDSLFIENYASSKEYDCDVSGRKLLKITSYGDGLAAIGNFSDCRIAGLQEGNVIYPAASYNPAREGDMYSDEAAQAYMGDVEYNEFNDSFAVCCRYADQLEITDMGTGLTKIVVGPDCLLPDYKVHQTGWGKAVEITDDTSYCYLDLCVDDSYIYVLYSGRKRSEKMHNYGNVVRVFDWDGTYRYNLLLDTYSISIAVADGELYSSSSDCRIMKYDLHGILQTK